MRIIAGPAWMATIVSCAAYACGDSGPTGTGSGTGTVLSGDKLPVLSCTMSDASVFSGGVARDGIPSLQDPELVTVGHPAAAYIEEYESSAANDPNSPVLRVVGLIVDGVPIAIPFNIFWWHEIVNMEFGGRRISLTYCPLTGTTIAFDISAANIDRFGVSGLIFQNNLIMFDAETESLWPQMCLGAGTGDRAGFELQTVPVVEMLWQTWKRRYPETLVVGSNTGYSFNYARYPFLSYEVSDLLLFPLPYPLDARAPMKERVLGIMDDAGGLAIPFSQLETIGSLAALRILVERDMVTVLWDREAQAAMAFRPFTEAGEAVTLSVVNGRFIDGETGSQWTIDGRAIDGPRAGEQLRHHARSYVAYWFAWASFFPRTRLWSE